MKHLNRMLIAMKEIVKLMAFSLAGISLIGAVAPESIVKLTQSELNFLVLWAIFLLVFSKGAEVAMARGDDS